MKIKTINVETVQLSCLLAGDEVAALSESVLENYKTVIAQTRTCAPLSVCFDGTEYWLFDGYHRLAVLEQLGITACQVMVYKGGRRDALCRYIADKLRSKEPTPQTRVFRHCLRRLRTDTVWSTMHPSQLASLFGRKPVFFENLRLWDPEKGHPDLAFSTNKHGTINLMRRRRG